MDSQTKSNYNQSENSVISINSTSNFGIINPESNFFDDQNFFGDAILNYRLCKVKVWYGTLDTIQGITGIQFYYKDRDTMEVISPGEYKGSSDNKDITDEGTDEFVLEPNEYLVDFKVAINTRVTNIEFVTNKKRSFKSGGTTGEVKKTHLTETSNVVIAAFGNYGSCLTAMGVYFMNRTSYFSVLFSGIFILKHCVLKPEFKEEIDKNYEKLSSVDKAIYKVCGLPNICFLCIMKYALI